jgi:hypothetical protein
MRWGPWFRMNSHMDAVRGPYSYHTEPTSTGLPPRSSLLLSVSQASNNSFFAMHFRQVRLDRHVNLCFGIPRSFTNGNGSSGQALE